MMAYLNQIWGGLGLHRYINQNTAMLSRPRKKIHPVLVEGCEWQPSLNTANITCMEQDVELVPDLSAYLYRCRIGEMGKNTRYKMETTEYCRSHF